MFPAREASALPGHPRMGLLESCHTMSAPMFWMPHLQSQYRAPDADDRLGPTGNRRFAARDTGFFQPMGMKGACAAASPMNLRCSVAPLPRILERPTSQTSRLGLSRSDSRLLGSRAGFQLSRAGSQLSRVHSESMKWNHEVGSAISQRSKWSAIGNSVVRDSQLSEVSSRNQLAEAQLQVELERVTRLEEENELEGQRKDLAMSMLAASLGGLRNSAHQLL